MRSQVVGRGRRAKLHSYMNSSKGNDSELDLLVAQGSRDTDFALNLELLEMNFSIEDKQKSLGLCLFLHDKIIFLNRAVRKVENEGSWYRSEAIQSTL